MQAINNNKSNHKTEDVKIKTHLYCVYIDYQKAPGCVRHSWFKKNGQVNAVYKSPQITPKDDIIHVKC